MPAREYVFPSDATTGFSNNSRDMGHVKSMSSGFGTCIFSERCDGPEPPAAASSSAPLLRFPAKEAIGIVDWSRLMFDGTVQVVMG